MFDEQVTVDEYMDVITLIRHWYETYNSKYTSLVLFNTRKSNPDHIKKEFIVSCFINNPMMSDDIWNMLTRNNLLTIWNDGELFRRYVFTNMKNKEQLIDLLLKHEGRYLYYSDRYFFCKTKKRSEYIEHLMKKYGSKDQLSGHDKLVTNFTYLLRTLRTQYHESSVYLIDLYFRRKGSVDNFMESMCLKMFKLVLEYNNEYSFFPELISLFIKHNFINQLFNKILSFIKMYRGGVVTFISIFGEKRKDIFFKTLKKCDMKVVYSTSWITSTIFRLLNNEEILELFRMDDYSVLESIYKEADSNKTTINRIIDCLSSEKTEIVLKEFLTFKDGEPLHLVSTNCGEEIFNTLLNKINELNDKMNPVQPQNKKRKFDIFDFDDESEDNQT